MKYNCRECINFDTILCKHCFFVSSPGGYEAAPTHYVERKSSQNAKQSKEAEQLRLALDAGEPLPLSVVMRYNEIGGKDDTA